MNKNVNKNWKLVTAPACQGNLLPQANQAILASPVQEERKDKERRMFLSVFPVKGWKRLP